MKLASDYRLLCIFSILLLFIALGLAILVKFGPDSGPKKFILYKPGGGIEPDSALENPNTWDTDWAEAIPTSDAPDVVLTLLFSQYFKWGQLPSHCVQHACFTGMLHHAERYVLKLTPDQFQDLQNKIAATLIDQQPQAVQARGWYPFTHAASDPPWWTPPNQSVFYFEISFPTIPETAYEGLQGSYRLEYDPKTGLLYLEASTV